MPHKCEYYIENIRFGIVVFIHFFPFAPFQAFKLSLSGLALSLALFLSFFFPNLSLSFYVCWFILPITFIVSNSIYEKIESYLSLTHLAQHYKHYFRAHIHRPSACERLYSCKNEKERRRNMRKRTKKKPTELILYVCYNIFTVRYTFLLRTQLASDSNNNDIDTREYAARDILEYWPAIYIHDKIVRLHHVQHKIKTADCMYRFVRKLCAKSAGFSVNLVSVCVYIVVG